MVNITKIVEKSLHDDGASSQDESAPPVSDRLKKFFGAEEPKKKKVEKIDFSDRLGAVFGVTEARSEQDG